MNQDAFNIWEGIHASFQSADKEATGPGFHGEIYRTRTKAAARECLEALNSGRPIPPFHKQRSTMLPPIVAMMLGEERKLGILDLGGGLGIGYMTLCECIPDAADKIDYTIVEMPEVCADGREMFEGLPGIRLQFIEKMPAEQAGYGLVHSASALQYIDDWRHVLAVLGSYGAQYILLSDVFAGNIPTFATLQNYYGSRMKHWFLNLDELKQAIAGIGYGIEMSGYVSSRRLNLEDVLPMGNFPPSHRLEQTLHLLLRRIR